MPLPSNNAGVPLPKAQLPAGVASDSHTRHLLGSDMMLLNVGLPVISFVDVVIPFFFLVLWLCLRDYCDDVCFQTF